MAALSSPRALDGSSCDGEADAAEPSCHVDGDCALMPDCGDCCPLPAHAATLAEVKRRAADCAARGAGRCHVKLAEHQRKHCPSHAVTEAANAIAHARCDCGACVAVAAP